MLSLRRCALLAPTLGLLNACSEGDASSEEPCVVYGTCRDDADDDDEDADDDVGFVSNPAHMGGTSVSDRETEDENIPPGDVEKPEYVNSTGLFVLDGRLYDRHGNEFLMRGVNNAHVWYDTGNRNFAIGALDDIADYGFNSVRIVWETRDKNPGATVALLREIVDCIVDLDMIPMIELHDVTGVPQSYAIHVETGELESWDNIDQEERNSYRPLSADENAEIGNAALMEMAEYFVSDEMKQLLLDYEDYLLVNIANEWSGIDWYGGYRAAIEFLRDEGIHHTLVIDANGWGQNAQVILDDGVRLLDADPERNLLFSTHMYESFSNNEQITYVFEEAAMQQLPLIVGEFGPEHAGRMIDVEFIFEEASRLGFGYLAWSWKGNGPGTTHLDMAVDWAGIDLTAWGETVVDGPLGVRETSQRASVFLF